MILLQLVRVLAMNYVMLQMILMVVAMLEGLLQMWLPRTREVLVMVGATNMIFMIMMMNLDRVILKDPVEEKQL
jgi:NADH:ubiquinone oxidoreductase subunit 6 (subunit J)